jgi:L-lysine exporter family protein LysE/ArgO
MLALLLGGIALGFTVAAPIGPVNLAVIRRSLAAGFMPAWTLGLGAGLADALYVILVFAGLSPLLENSFAFRLVLWGVGGAFLIYLGLSGMQAQRKQPAQQALSDLAADPSARVELHPFLAGFGITLLNPMTVVSWAAIGGAFFAMFVVEPGIVNGMLLAGSVFLGSILWSGLVALTIHFARRLVNARVLRIVSVVASLALIIFGLGFLVEAAQTILV